MSDIPYIIAGKTTKKTAVISGQTFQNQQRPGQNVLPLDNPPSFRARSWRVIPINLTVAQNVDLILQVTGAAFWIPNGTAATDVVRVAFNSDTDYLTLSPGNFIIGFPFSQIRVQWAAQGTDQLSIATTDVYPDEDFRVQ